jgi:hypothetical protein
MKNVVLMMVVLSCVAIATPLYAPTPPPNSAFVRLVNAGTMATRLVIGQKAWSLQSQESSAYSVLKEGAYTLSGGTTTTGTSIQLEAGNFYTAILLSGKWWINTDRTNSSLTQARIAVYNASSLTVSVKTADGKLALWEKLAAKQYQMRPVNAVKVRLAVFVNSKVLALPETELEPNTAYSIFIFGDAKTQQAIWLRNRTEAL